MKRLEHFMRPSELDFVLRIRRDMRQRMAKAGIKIPAKVWRERERRDRKDK